MTEKVSADALALLKILEHAEAEIAEGKVSPARESFARIRERAKTRRSDLTDS